MRDKVLIKNFKLIEPIINIRNYVSKIKKFNKSYPSAKSISNTLNHKKYLFCDFVRMIQYPTGGGFLLNMTIMINTIVKVFTKLTTTLTVKKIKGKKKKLSNI